MYFETAGIHVSIWLPPLVAFAISFFTSMGGVSGAFLLLPFQMSVLGYTAPSVSATNQLFNVVAIPSGVYRFVREGRMVWALTWVVVVGTVPGVLIGAIVRVRYLPDPATFKLFAAAVLLYIGGRMVRDLTIRKQPSAVEDAEQSFHKSVRRNPTSVKSGRAPATTTATSFGPMRIEYEFQGERYRVSTVGVFILCLLVGIVGGIYGIGGGSIVAPFFVSFFHLPVYTIAGAALMGTLVTSVAGIAFFHIIAPYYPAVSVAPDWRLGILFGVGGAVGMYLGARCQKFVPARLIKGMLAGIIVLTAGRFVWAFVVSLG